MGFKTIKYKPILGALPEMGVTDWWTQEDWDKHNAYVERLKSEGKYLTEGEEITVHLKDYDIFKHDKPFDECFTNFGLLIPKGND